MKKEVKEMVKKRTYRGKKRYLLEYWSVPTKRMAQSLAKQERRGTGGAIIKKTGKTYSVYSLG